MGLKNISILLVLFTFLLYFTNCKTKDNRKSKLSINKIDTIYNSIRGTPKQKCTIIDNINFCINSDTLFIKDTFIVVKVKPSEKMARFILETNWGKDCKWVKNNNPGGLFNGKKYLTFSDPYQGWAKMGECIYRLKNKYSEKDTTKSIKRIINLYNLETLDNL